MTHDSAATRPNIVFLLTDDQGPWAVPWRMPELHMPHLDALAAEGIVFDNFYCASPVCSPARASLMTGRMPSAHGIHDWLTGTRHPQAHPDRYLDELTTLPAVLAGAGYRCAMSGKWHLGESQQTAAGFESWYAHRFGGGPYFGAPIWRDGQEASEEEYFTDAVGDHAIEFLRAYARDDGDAPFYLQMCTTAPHDPWDRGNHPSDLLSLYEGCAFDSVPREERHPWAEPRKADFEDAFADPVPSLQGYCAALSGVDRILGRVREELEALGLAENTIIAYMSDNGFSCGHHGVWGKGNGTWPLNMWENSVRVPFVLYIPPALSESFHVEGARHEDGHISALNFFPTICEFAGAQPPADPMRPGTSLLPMLAQQEADRAPVVVFDEYGGTRMIRDGDWKYVLRFEGPEELYNLREDPQERHNCAGEEEYCGLIATLRERLEAWFAAHETAQHRAFDQPVSGHGQIHPTWRRDESVRYVLPGEGNNH